MTVPFNDAVLAWLRKEDPDAAAIVKLETDGSDWNGDTFSGFWSEFKFTIRYTKVDGREDWMEVEGSNMADLWMHVMRSWPTPGQG